MFHSLKQRLGLQHHSFTAAKRPVIHGPMAILCKLAQVLHVHFNNSRLSRAPQNSVIQRTRKKIRENSNEVKAHRREKITPNLNRANLPGGGPQYAARRHQCAYRYPRQADLAPPLAGSPLPKAAFHAHSRPRRETAYRVPYPTIAEMSPSHTEKKSPPTHGPLQTPRN